MRDTKYQRESGRRQEDRGFKKGSRDLKQENKGYNKEDRGRGQEKRGFGEKRDEKENIVIGRNPVLEVLKSGRGIEKLFVIKEAEGSLKMIIGKARDRGIIISEVDRRKLDEMSGGESNQGIVAVVSPYEYSTIDDMLNLAKQRGEDPFLIILDEIEDPHNMGSIIRSANACGAHGVLIPKRRSALITATVAKASAGAIEYTKIAKITNINQTIKELKDKGLWVIGADMDGETCYRMNLRGAIALVIGSEGKGISRLVRENCDGIASIPMKGSINSLNASVAAGIIMYEVQRQRGIQSE